MATGARAPRKNRTTSRDRLRGQATTSPRKDDDMIPWDDVLFGLLCFLAGAVTVGAILFLPRRRD